MDPTIPLSIRVGHDGPGADLVLTARPADRGGGTRRRLHTPSFL